MFRFISLTLFTFTFLSSSPSKIKIKHFLYSTSKSNSLTYYSTLHYFLLFSRLSTFLCHRSIANKFSRMCDTKSAPSFLNSSRSSSTLACFGATIVSSTSETSMMVRLFLALRGGGPRKIGQKKKRREKDELDLRRDGPSSKSSPTRTFATISGRDSISTVLHQP